MALPRQIHDVFDEKIIASTVITPPLPQEELLLLHKVNACFKEIQCAFNQGELTQERQDAINASAQEQNKLETELNELKKSALLDSSQEKRVKELITLLAKKKLLTKISIILKAIVKQNKNSPRKEGHPFHGMEPAKISIEEYFFRLAEHFKSPSYTFILMLHYIMRYCFTNSDPLNVFNVNRVILMSLLSAHKYNDDYRLMNTVTAQAGGVTPEELNSMARWFSITAMQFNFYVPLKTYNFYATSFKLPEMTQEEYAKVGGEPREEDQKEDVCFIVLEEPKCLSISMVPRSQPIVNVKTPPLLNDLGKANAADEAADEDEVDLERDYRDNVEPPMLVTAPLTPATPTKSPVTPLTKEEETDKSFSLDCPIVGMKTSSPSGFFSHRPPAIFTNALTTPQQPNNGNSASINTSSTQTGSTQMSASYVETPHPSSPISARP